MLWTWIALSIQLWTDQKPCEWIFKGKLKEAHCTHTDPYTYTCASYIYVQVCACMGLLLLALCAYCKANNIVIYAIGCFFFSIFHENISGCCTVHARRPKRNHTILFENRPGLASGWTSSIREAASVNFVHTGKQTRRRRRGGGGHRRRCCCCSQIV